MKRRLSLLMTLVIALCTSSAWAQSIVSVGTNLDFSEGTPVDNGICTCDYDMEKNNTVYSQMVAVSGWELGNENGNNRAGGLFAYGSNHWLGGTGYNVPATNPEGVAEGNALGIVSTWGASTSYVQAVTLGAGDYVISVLVYNAVGGTSVPAKSLIGFIADNGAEYLAAAKAYPVGTWTVENIKFTLTEATTGKLTLGYTSAGSGSAANQHLFFDKVEILYEDLSADDVRGVLNAALVSAQATVDAKVGVGAGVFMYSEEAYNTYAAAVAAAKAVSEKAEATVDELKAAVAALNAATAAYTVTAPAADAVYAVKFNGTENYLTIGESTITIEAAVDTLSFEAVGNGKYYVHDNVGKYLSYAGNNKWTMTASADVKDEWTISVNAEGLYTFVGKNGGIGVDGTEAGASCYGDKNGAAVALWTIAEIVIEDEPVVPEEPKTDYTDAIKNASVAENAEWEGGLGHGNGGLYKTSAESFDFTQTITLPAGQYKMTVQAAYRYAGSNDTPTAEEFEYNQIQAGVETHLAKLYAQTSSYKYEANVKNRWEGASETNYAEGENVSTVNGKFVPNSSNAVKAWFDNGMYVNELVFNVQEEGAVKIGIAKTTKPAGGDYTNIGAWTLTRLGDAEADPKEEEPTPEEPEVPAIIVWNINPADYPAGVQYADEAHVINDTLTIYTANKGCHWTKEIRIYHSSTNDGYIYSNQLPAAIKSIAFNAGYKNAALSVYGSNDGAVWTKVAEVPVATSYKDLVVDFTGTAYNYFKIDAETAQVRIKSLTITLDTTVELPKVVAAPSFSLNGCNLFAPATVELTAEEGATIYWSTDDENYVEYSTALAIDSTCTVYAYAQIGNSKSTVASAKYVMAATYDNIAALLASETTSAGVPVIVKFTAVVDSFGYNKNNEIVSVFLVEGTDTLMVYDYNIPADYVKGVTVAGQLAGIWKDYKGTLELCNVDYSGAVIPYFANGDYLIVNTETGCYLGGGNDWGTHASLLRKPQFFTFAHQGGNAYTLDSHQSNGGDSHFLGTGLYCDAAAANWTFTKTENGNYTINNAGNYLAGDGEGKVIVTVTDATVAAAEWTIISRAEAIAGLDNANAGAPVDATFYINNPEVKRNAGGWTITSADGTGTPSNYAMGSGGNNANCAESYHSTNGFDFSQVLVGMKPGVYRFDAHAFYRNDGDNTGEFPYFYVNEQQSLFPELTGSENSMAAAYASFLNGSYAIVPIYFTVAEGDEIKIGVHGGNTAFWNIWGEFGLTYYGVDASIAEIKASSVYADYNEVAGKHMNVEVKAAMEAAKVVYEAEASDDNLAAFTAAVAAAVSSANTYAISKPAIDAMFALMQSTNVYTAEAYATYSAKAEEFLTQYEAGTLTVAVDNPATIHGWRASVDYDDLLLSAFGVKDFDTNLYINTWSTEGETDGSEFKVPFFEYWTGDGESLGATTKTATMTGLTPGQYYSVEAWVRVRAKNGVDAADATGITLSVGAGKEVDITEGEVVGTSQFSHAVFTAKGAADENGNLTINFNVLADNNISWLSFKNLKYAEVEMLPVVGVKVGDVDVVEGVATVEAVSTFDVTFDRPVALAENAGWATLTDSLGENSLQAEVLADNNCVVRFSLQWGQEFTEGGEYILNIPEGFVVDAANSDCGNAAIEAVITIEAAPATPLAVVNVTVGENVMEGFSFEAKPTDMIRVNFDGQFYYQGMPSIVDAEGNDASGYFQFVSGLDFDGSNSYIFMPQNWEGAAAPAGIYTITLAKASFLQMMQWKAPAEDIVLTVKIVAEGEGIDNIAVDADAVIYDLSGRRVTEMTKGIYIVNGKKVIKK